MHVKTFNKHSVREGCSAYKGDFLSPEHKAELKALLIFLYGENGITGEQLINSIQGGTSVDIDILRHHFPPETERITIDELTDFIWKRSNIANFIE